MSRRVTVSSTSNVRVLPETTDEPSRKLASRKEGTADFSHFRGADDPTWHQIEVKRAISAPSKNSKLHETSTNQIHDSRPRDKRPDICIEERMSRIDVFADKLLSMAEGLHNDMTSANEIDKLNENFNGPARPRIINQGKREMRKNKRIMAENKELRHALAEHQTVLEMVMNKFRKVSTHAARLEREQSFLAPANKTYELRKENQKLADRVGDMITVMKTAASKYPTENESYLQIKTNMKQLQDENRGLRSLLSLSRKSGSHKLDLASPVEATHPVNCATEDSDDESVETCSTNSHDTVITNSSDDEEISVEAAEAFQNGPEFHDFIDSMVKDAINNHIKGVKENSRFENEKDQNPEIEPLRKDEDTISLSSNASTIVENGFDHIADELLEEEAIKEVELLDQLLDAEEKIEERQIDRSASPLSVDDDVSTESSLEKVTSSLPTSET